MNNHNAGMCPGRKIDDVGKSPIGSNENGSLILRELEYFPVTFPSQTMVADIKSLESQSPEDPSS